MKIERLLAFVVAGFIGFVAISAWRVKRRAPAVTAEALPTTATPSGDTVALSATYTAPVPTAERLARATVARQRLATDGGSTYLAELLTLQDSVIRRWPDRSARPVRVWMQDGSRVANWSPDLVRAVQEGFDGWGMEGVPVSFLFVSDSVGAEVPVVWEDRLPDSRVGVTRVIAWNDTLTTATITIATHRSDGSLLSIADVRRTALHEAGHLLGLPHNDDPTSIMAAGSRSNALNERDRASVRLLYRLPWGDIKVR